MASEDNIVGKVDRMVSDCYSYAWTINNFCVCCPSVSLKTSPEFRTGLINKENVWTLELCQRSDSNSMDIFLTLKDTVENTIEQIDYEFSILNKEKQKANRSRGTCFIKKGEVEAMYKFINKEYIMKSACMTIPNKQLTILCEINESLAKKVKKHGPQKLIADFQYLFENPKHADAKIVVGEKTFDVHKAILVSRSSWFRAAFEGGMQEQQESKVTVSNYDCDVVQEVLRFIYTGQVKDDTNFVDRLLDAAVFYQLGELETICSDIMYNKE